MNIFEEHPEFKTALDNLLASLTPREEKVVRMLIQNKTVKEIAEHFSVSEDRVRQIFDRAKRKIQSPSRKNLLNEAIKHYSSVLMKRLKKLYGVKDDVIKID